MVLLDTFDDAGDGRALKEQRLASFATELTDQITSPVLWADSIRAMHEAGVVHRDLRPRNVCLEWRGGDASRPPVVKLIGQAFCGDPADDRRTGAGRSDEGRRLGRSASADIMSSGSCGT